MKLDNGEDSDNRSGDDKDSGNESRIKKKAAKKRGRGGGFPFGGNFMGGFGGGFPFGGRRRFGF